MPRSQLEGLQKRIEAYEEILPDSVKLEDKKAGYDWVRKDVVSRWRVYRLVTGAHTH
jgi:hypothetical protein